MIDRTRLRRWSFALPWLAAAIVGCQRPPEPAASVRPERSDAETREDTQASDAAETAAIPVILPTDAADLELDGAVEARPAERRDEGARAARELITWVRPCLGSIAAGATVRATVAFEGNAFARATVTIASTEPRSAIAPIEACAQHAASALSIGPRALQGAAELTANYRVVRRPVGALNDPARRCERDQDCRLTVGTCAGPAPVHYLHATMRGSINARALAERQCPQANVTPSQPRCERGLCVAAALPEPAWRSCTRTQECVTLVGASGSIGAIGAFTAVNRESVARAMRLWPEARVARPADRPPVVSCEQRFCALGWVPPDREAIIPRPMR